MSKRSPLPTFSPEKAETIDDLILEFERMQSSLTKALQIDSEEKREALSQHFDSFKELMFDLDLE